MLLRHGDGEATQWTHNATRSYLRSLAREKFVKLVTPVSHSPVDTFLSKAFTDHRQVVLLPSFISTDQSIAAHLRSTACAVQNDEKINRCN